MYYLYVLFFLLVLRKYRSLTGGKVAKVLTTITDSTFSMLHRNIWILSPLKLRVPLHVEINTSSHLITTSTVIVFEHHKYFDQFIVTRDVEELFWCLFLDWRGEWTTAVAIPGMRYEM